uniref:Ciliogenesis-associated TTC17-interacting protein n=1 Tax=Monopterus albus TaxID=43700 RepID=A0A3Q3Q681_MONAL
METPLEEETSVDVPPLFSEPAELQKCVFPDSLVTVSEGGRDLGKFTVTVEFACRVQRPCLLLRAQSQGAIDDAPCGTIVTGDIFTFLDKRCHMVQHDGQMVINKVTTIGEVMKESVSYPMSALRGLVTEGSNLLLMRLIALRKMVPEHMTFISFDQGLYITHTIFQLEVDGEAVEVFGVERTVHSVEDSPTIWQCYFLDDGHLANRVQVGSPVTMRLLQLPSHLEKGSFEKIPLVWEEDMQMRSMLLDRKEELMADHASYLRQHPEIRALISDFLQFLLLRKPDNVFQFAREYFQPFASHHTPEQCLKAHSF